MKRKNAIISLILIGIVSLTACGMPDLNDEQQEMVTEYATALLLKYDSANHSRLVDTSEFLAEYESAVSTYEAEKTAYYDAKQKEEDKRREENRVQEESNSQTSTSESSHDGTGGATVIDKNDIETVLGLNNVSVDFLGCETTDVYPKDEQDLIFTISATKSSDLVILYFNVTNNSNQSQNLDFYSMDNPFKISVNSGAYKSALQSFVLEDDLTMFKGSLGAGESRKFVLITEVKKGSSVNKLNLRTVYKDKSATRVLK